jgi:hypothetical protein
MAAFFIVPQAVKDYLRKKPVLHGCGCTGQLRAGVFFVRAIRGNFCEDPSHRKEFVQGRGTLVIVKDGFNLLYNFSHSGHVFYSLLSGSFIQNEVGGGRLYNGKIAGVRDLNAGVCSSNPGVRQEHGSHAFFWIEPCPASQGPGFTARQKGERTGDQGRIKPERSFRFITLPGIAEWRLKKPKKTSDYAVRKLNRQNSFICQNTPISNPI